MDQENKNTGQNEGMTYSNGVSGNQEPTRGGRPAPAKKSFLSKWWFWLIVVLLVGIGAFLFMSDSPLSGMDNVANEELGEAVAMVNGEAIERTEFEARFTQLERNIQAQAQAQGQEVSQEQLDAQRNQLLTALIDNELMVQAAKEQGISVTDEEVETYYQDVVLGSVESEAALEQQLSGNGFTIADLKENIRIQFLVEEYVTANADEGELEVSEEEARGFYDQLVAGGQSEDVPPFEAVQPQLEQQLAQQKQDTVAQRLVQELRANAEIERLL